jgi:zinc transport system permease protein
MFEILQQSFLLRALLAGFALALIAAPLGCFVIWRRMAYFGETMAQAGLIGVALGLMLSINMTASVLIVAFLVSLLLIALSRQSVLPFDSLLGLIAHAALAIGVIVASLVRGPQIDMMGYLFGDIFAVNRTDLLWICGGGVIVLGAMLWLWRPLLATAVHEELAAAEGVDTRTAKAAFIILLALTIAIAMKIVGVLLTIAFLIIPGSAARPLAETPEQMALLAAVLGMMGVAGGLYMSVSLDTPGGPSIVVVMTGIFIATCIPALLRGRNG